MEYSKDPQLLHMSHELRALVASGSYELAIELLDDEAWSLMGLFQFEHGFHINGVEDSLLIGFIYEVYRYCKAHPESILSSLVGCEVSNGEILRLASHLTRDQLDMPRRTSQPEQWLLGQACCIQGQGLCFSLQSYEKEEERSLKLKPLTDIENKEEQHLNPHYERLHESVRTHYSSCHDLQRAGGVRLGLWVSCYLLTLEQWRHHHDIPILLHPNLFQPIHQVYGRHIFEYCNKRSVSEGFDPVYSVDNQVLMRDPKASGYRLPTQREWLSLALADTAWPFSGGMFYEHVGWFAENSRRRVRVIGQLAANKLGLFDVSGNVEELCEPDVFLEDGTHRGYGTEQYGFGRYVLGCGGNVTESHEKSSLKRKPLRISISAKPKIPSGIRLVRSLVLD